LRIETIWVSLNRDFFIRTSWLDYARMLRLSLVLF